tara:strand:- start:1650 stop:2210 length:561 start_codon:yes stop_codon:yes gene_type:complete
MSIGRCDKRRMQIFRFWTESPNCHWCGQPTLLIFRGAYFAAGENFLPFRDNEATIDHLNSKLSSERGQYNDGKRRRVLSCKKCNHNRSVQEHIDTPIEELRERCSKGMKMSALKKIINEYKDDIVAMLLGEEDVDNEALSYALYEYYVDDMPIGTAKGRDGDPDEWVFNQLQKEPEIHALMREMTI